jgi:signal transduction histidine kinase/ActR/RegA family two-component response regulator
MSSRVPRRWLLPVAAVFCVYSLLLLWNAFQSQQQLRVAADARLVADSKRRAAALADVAGQRRSVAQELATLHEVQTYLVNRALGMSPRYGLNSSLAAVEVRLRARVDGPQSAGGRALTRAAFVDASGLPLVDTAPAAGALPAVQGLEPMLTLDPAHGVIVATAPVTFKGEFNGTVITISPIGELYDSLISLASLGSYRETLLTTAGHEILAPAHAATSAKPDLPAPAPVMSAAHAAKLLALPPNQLTELSGWAGHGEGASTEESMAVMTPVPGLPAVLVTTLSRSEIYGQLSSPVYLGALSVFPMLLMMAALRMARLQQRAHALQLDAALQDANRQLLQQRNEGLAREIQRRQAVERELQRHRNQLEDLVRQRTGELNRLFHALPDLYFRTTRDGTILEHRVGREADLLVGPDDFLDRRIEAVLPPEAARAFAAALAELAQGADQSVVEYGLLLPQGQRYFEARLLPLGDDQCVIVVRNVTERRENDQVRDANRLEAERLVRLKSEFLANMSHEIRTPLNAVLGLAQLGARDDDAAAARIAFQRIEDAGRHLLSIIDDILDLSKLEAGKLSVEQQPFRLGGTVDAAVALVAGRTAVKGLHLRATLADGLPEWVQGDALRVKQVLVNLLSNAVKFTAHGEVALSVSGAGGQISFSVADTGIGIDATQLARLFQPFEQADSSTTRRFGGTGLGLAISRNLAGLMGGDIGVTSQPGRGSTFTLSLPLAAAAAPLAASPCAPVAKRRLAGLRLLAAEDVEVNRIVLQGQLEHEGAEVVFAEDGQQAVDAVASALQSGTAGFDAVLMDVQMPVLDGLESTRQIRRLAPRLPVIGFTAHAMNDERESCLAAGMVERVVKPADLDLLVAALRRHVTLAEHAPATERPCAHAEAMMVAVA